MTERTLRGMAQIPGLKTYGISDPDSPTFALRGGVIPFSLKGMVSHTVARELAARGGIGVRAGCHCAHLTVKRMLGIPAWAQEIQRVMLTLLRRMELPGVVRVSLGIENGEDDVDTLLRVLGDTARRHGGKTDKKAARRQMDDLAETAARRVYAESAWDPGVRFCVGYVESLSSRASVSARPFLRATRVSRQLLGPD